MDIACFGVIGAMVTLTLCMHACWDSVLGMDALKMHEIYAVPAIAKTQMATNKAYQV